MPRQPGQPNACNLPLNTLPDRPVRGPGLRLVLSLDSALVNQFGTPAQWDVGIWNMGFEMYYQRWMDALDGQPFYGP